MLPKVNERSRLILEVLGARAMTVSEITDELVADGKTHLRIDYKVSGIGSNSCGPELMEKYRLAERNITFGFTISPKGKN